MLTPRTATEGREQLREEGSSSNSQARVVELEARAPSRSSTESTPPRRPSPGAPTDAECAPSCARRAPRSTAFASTEHNRLLAQPHPSPGAPRRHGCGARWGTRAGQASDTRREPDCQVPLQVGRRPRSLARQRLRRSGSVSFALAGAGLLGRPLTSGLLAGYGRPGPGRWITIYANSGHVFMTVAGLRFDTSGQGRAGTRWQAEPVSTSGFAVRHVPGL